MKAATQLKLDSALRQMMRSERGQTCLQGLEAFLENSCRSLDSQNQSALLNIATAFFESGHDTLDIIRETLNPTN